ncbi:MAG: heparan N-sulfatase, partial [Planctomycetota bacterium]
MLLLAIRGKVSHSTPYQPYSWDADLTTLDGKKQHVKNIDSYYLSTRRGIELAAAAGKPFCINVNI